jgi:Tfp pilus assembly protein PilE
MNNDKTFTLLTYLTITAVIAITLTCFWQSYLSYLNRKLLIEAAKNNNASMSIEQIQGLVNSKQ